MRISCVLTSNALPSRGSFAFPIFLLYWFRAGARVDACTAPLSRRPSTCARIASGVIVLNVTTGCLRFWPLPITLRSLLAWRDCHQNCNVHAFNGWAQPGSLALKARRPSSRHTRDTNATNLI